MNIKDYFSFTRREKRGIVVLLLIIIILIIANFSVDLLKSNQQTDFSQFENEINEFEKSIQADSNNSLTDNLKIELFEFNPNTITDEEWKKLGFVAWQIKTINNYKAKGGGWKTKEDVKKIYGLEESHYEQLKPFILLPDEKASPTEWSFGRENKFNDTSKKESRIKYGTKITYFYFDPNTISKEQWEKLGFKDWQIKAIFNYKEKGGKWKTKADVKKIYGLAEADYLKLEPFILLPDAISPSEKVTSKKDYTTKVHINTATAKELTNLKGINSEKYAELIIKYRTELGGFVRKEQLKEVWNLKEETYNEFVNQIELGNNLPQQININKASAEELKIHPYFNWNTANAIVKYRKSNGNFKKVEDLKKIHIIDDETFLKIAPYLTTN
ncbi:MAG: hypothetical protein A3K10_03635 [Bacteroidetes bacterium RIFCSPLOWO2_12_FULL_31_6]|nr:MAG: hypothetical protein A3K10_03635 [Bacteroidetes bacterium RIFCSPLOWO2_12_FULL_31_6]